jgi:cobalt-zinc-cadmium efflux system outer membrane protein
VPLPLFKHNAAGIGQASSELSQVRIEREAAARDLRAQVYTLWAKVQSLQARVRRLKESVLPALADNQQLSVKSRLAGQIGLLELIVVNRQALDARRDLIDALGDLQATRHTLEAAAGWQQQGNQQ